MRLSAGARLGSYEIVAALGAGGMGEVYRASDRRLNRDVAIKVLLPAVANDPDRLTRFSREAQVLASLNHPNIAHIHGLEESDGIRALVMELVEGPTLADRIARGPIALEEALPIAKQIAEALEAAHQQGIIHRDLKPANLKVRPDGTVKVLDFGLAKAMDPIAASTVSPTMSPTLTVNATVAGIMLGTAAYMSPEQAKGRPADKRSDLWAFGCVLFEMLTGRQTFGSGETVAEAVAAILKTEPDWTALPAETPAALRRLVRRCLEKDHRRRLDSAAVARLEIDDALTLATTDALPTADVDRRSRVAGWRLAGLVAVAGLAVAVAAFTAGTVTRPAHVPAAPVSRFAISLPPAQQLAHGFNDRDIAMSADGTRIVYTAGDQARLMVRALDQLDAVPLAGVANARAPFLSPDGRWVGYFERLDEGTNVASVMQRTVLRRVSIAGGPPNDVATLTGASRGAVWGPNDAILLATSDTSTGILRCPVSTGELSVLTRPDAAQGEPDHYFPSLLPGARGVLFTIVEPGRRGVAVLDAQTGARKTLIQSGSQAEYVESGHLIYADRGALWAVRFDLSTLQVIGDAVPVVDQVLTLGAADFAVAPRGTVVYAPIASSRSRSLAWITRDGAEQPIAAPARAYMRARISPDGKRAAIQLSDRRSQIWTWDFARATFTSLLFDSSMDFLNPIWTPSGTHLVFGMSINARTSDLYRRAADGTGANERLTNNDRTQRPNAITPDGRYLIFEELTPTAGYDFMQLSLTGPPRVEPLLGTPFDERDASVSPDGRWMAYESNDSGQSQVYVRRFPRVDDARYLVSTGGGRTPVWSPTGREIFFVSGSSILAAAVELTPTFSAVATTKLFDSHSSLLDGRFGGSGSVRTYDVSPDGKRFLMIKDNAAIRDDQAPPAASLVVVQNWLEELKAKVPTK
jgi:eukaryotic-like serine/threonine-protein kinase